MNDWRFDPNADLIVVKARVEGKHDSRVLSLALDTAASHTHIQPDLLDELGYSPRDGEAITAVRSAVGKEPGYMLRVLRFEAFDYRFENFLIHAHGLPTGFGIDGLLGLSSLRHFNYEIRSREGRILMTPVEAS